MILFGCTSPQPQQTIYICSNGSQVLNPAFCSSPTGTAGTSASNASTTTNISAATNTSSAGQTAAVCISNTKDDPQCKDCCDCINGTANDRKSCRDTCATHDFSLNSGYINVNTASILGKSGDYSAATAAGTEQACKEYCDGSPALSCGDRRYCRDACNAMGNGTANAPPNNGTGNNPPPQAGNGTGNQPLPLPNNGNGSQSQNQYNIEQATSDRAQLSTLSFSALAFITGDACSDSFLPPGKVADFSGFQYLRDNDPDMMGHNTEFVTMAADNVLTILDANQTAEFIAIDPDQGNWSDEYGYMRFPLMNAFRRELTGDIPTGTTGLNKSAVMGYSGRLYTLDAQISLERAKAFGRVFRSLSPEQKAYLDKMGQAGSLSWPKVSEPAILKTSGISSVNLRTYASEFYGWYAGSVEADTYFCPERQATYFGGFYMKDAPAMGNRNYSISTTRTANSGEGFLAELNDTQRSGLTGLVDIQRNDLNEIVSTREAIVIELRKLMAQETVNDSMVLALGERYGELDGEIAYDYAMHFSDVSKTLSVEQKAEALKLRDLENFTCDGAYLYSEKIPMPAVENTDHFFQ